MNWTWEFTKQAEWDLKKLPKNVARRLVKKLDYFVGSGNPLEFSEPLVNADIGQYRFRVGDYRIIIDVEREVVVVLTLGHRKEIYR